MVRRRNVPMLLVCSVLLSCATAADADDWPQWRGPKRDGVWRERGVVKTLPARLECKWRTPIGAGYTGPAVVGNRVFVTDRLKAGSQGGGLPARDQERALCLDATTGEIIWVHAYDCQYEVGYPAGPRATPTVHEDKVYTVGSMGDFFCFNTSNGDVVWKVDYVEDYGAAMNMWGMSAAPLVVGEKLILLIGGKSNACVVAFNKDTGQEIWRALSDEDPGYSPPVLINEGGRRQLIVWTPSALYSLDPETGKTFWVYEAAVGTRMSIATPVYDSTSRLLFVSSFFTGPVAMRLDRDKPVARLAWKGTSSSEIKTDKLHSLMCTAVIDGDHLYGFGSYGELRCLELSEGQRVWESLKATGKGRWWNAFLIPHEDRYFICNEQGELITARLSPSGYEETSRSFLIEPTQDVQRRKIVWSHPAFANRSIYARNDKEIICVDLTAR